MSKTNIEHVLRTVWSAHEDSNPSLEYIRKTLELEHFEDELQEAVEKGLLKLENDKVFFTPAGEKLASEIIRRHRLAERLFADVFEAPKGEYENLACTFEHVISQEVTDSVCTFLGHPRVCPHNRPIPRGKCCVTYVESVKPLVQPLSSMEVGQRARIVYMVPSYKKRWGQLHQIGVYPGNVIRLIQHKPSIVIEVGETTLALDDAICREIFVKRIDNNSVIE